MTLFLTATLLLCGCSRKPPQTSSSPEPTDSDTSTTGHTASDSVPPIVDTGPEWPDALAPYQSYYREEGDTTGGTPQTRRHVQGVTALPDVTGDGKPELWLHRPSHGDLLSGLPDVGTQVPLSALPSVEAPLLVEGKVAYAGDVNGDGVGDLWLTDCLHLGPYDPATAGEGLCMSLHDPSDPAPTVFGDFDGDLDGSIDMAFVDRSNHLRVLYGPFDEARPEDDERHQENTTFGPRGGCPQNTSAWFGPGNDPAELLVAVAGYDLCPPIFMDVAGPRGRTLTVDDRVATLGTDMQPPLRNLKGDGLVDIAVFGEIHDEPTGAVGAVGEGQKLAHGSVHGGIRDVTGDGRDEVLVWRRRHPLSPDSDWLWYVVPGRGDLDGADASELGIHLGGQWDHGCREFTSHDLDGDGAAEVIGWGPDAMAIWRGSDIRAALDDAGLLDPSFTEP
jgi:hypothetical protein